MTEKSYGRRFLPVDWIVIGYSLLTAGLILLLGRPLEQYARDLLFYSSMAGLAVLIVRYVDGNSGWFRSLIRFLYAGFMMTFFYTMTDGIMHLFFDQFFDPQLTAFEYSILGFNPNILIDRQLLNVWTTEILSFCYASYYLMIPVFLLALFFKKEFAFLQRSLASICITFFIGYLLFILYPIEGPRYYFAGAFLYNIEGIFFRPLVEFVIANGAVHGGCMPSTHFAVALIILMYCFKRSRTTGWLLSPIVLGLAAGTIWGRYHYVSDVIVGGLIALFAYWFVEKYYDRWIATEENGKK